MYTSSKHSRPCLRLYNKYCDIACMLHSVLDIRHWVWLDMKWHIGCRYITIEHNNLKRRKKRHISTLENSTTSSFILLRVTVYQNRKQWVRFLRANVWCTCIYLVYLPLQLASFNFLKPHLPLYNLHHQHGFEHWVKLDETGWNVFRVIFAKLNIMLNV